MIIIFEMRFRADPESTPELACMKTSPDFMLLKKQESGKTMRRSVFALPA